MRQHTTPIIVQNTKIKLLEKIDLAVEGIGEEWLQSKIHSNPTVLPIQEIEPAFANQVAICRELPTESGYCDNLLINDGGYITIVECKLWKNPDARRKVVAQILDYAKDMAHWSYQKLESNALAARGNSSESLFNLVQAYYPDIEENNFIDQVQKNLSAARFLLLIVGDGVRQSTEDITEFLQKFGDMSFSMALIEMPLYRIDHDSLILTPRVLLRTTEIVRSIIRIEDNRSMIVSPSGDEKTPQTNTEAIFYERLATSSGSQTVTDFAGYIQSLLTDLPLITKIGRGKKISLNIKSADDQFNFASIQDR